MGELDDNCHFDTWHIDQTEMFIQLEEPIVKE